MGWFAAFSAKRNGREIRAIGFHHECIGRDSRCDCTDICAVLESYDAGERNKMTKIENFIGLFRRAPKAMKYTAYLPTVIAQNLESVIPRIALMNYDIQPQFNCEIEKLLK